MTPGTGNKIVLGQCQIWQGLPVRLLHRLQFSEDLRGNSEDQRLFVMLRVKKLGLKRLGQKVSEVSGDFV
jgi:hypothetical protein